MWYTAAFDSGTTALKGALVAEDGRIVASASSDLTLIINGDFREQDPDEWWRAFCKVSQTMLAQAQEHEPGCTAAQIAGIIFSGQMQDVIALDAELKPVCTAILYSDGRADAEAEQLRNDYRGGAARFLETVGNRLEGCLPLPKLMWLRNHEPATFERVRHVLISSKDYLIAQLTGTCIGDVAACSTAGAMNIREGQWDVELCEAAGIDIALLPELHKPQDRIGTVTAAAAALTGFAAGTAVYAGIGDAGATTFASGVAKPGQYNINIGTSGWIATVSPEPFVNKPGAANLAFGVEPGFVNAVPFLNAGDVHKWVTGVFAHGDYAESHELIAASAPGANDVLCLPYLVGERFPVMNPTIRGAYVGITPDTTQADMARAALEGVAFSIRQGMESFDAAPVTISLIGGGARESTWCQILADALNHPIDVYANADILPAVALASLVFNQPDLASNIAETTTYVPNPSAVHIYDECYPRFLKLYPAVASLNGQVQ
ncbi:gluconate kinase [Bifidobacterium imperatoris]|uniref:Gluconate kinase n=1 Tax=Bifidobacterium imperatoris TaxID=2020965 RepID=A0A2N5ITA5_9BIFI|nr:FGGY family carbohydrate kinase [Bifidobacterium imperatoris]PLS25171.1 gluconate kinase [Bifidobacterium imperatoris]QSY57715.1 gluconate kinase [Bifidobacterium imperatoris]